MNLSYRETIEKLGMKVGMSSRVLGISRRQSTRFAAGAKLSAPVRKLLKLMVDYKIDPKEVEGF